LKVACEMFDRLGPIETRAPMELFTWTFPSPEVVGPETRFTLALTTAPLGVV
jgi:hypothetical protein